jgi:IS30 family transposase
MSLDALTMDEVAIKMNRSKSIISRELKRNSIEEKLYLPGLQKYLQPLVY